MSSRPNVLIVCTDQQNWSMNSVNGHPLVRTPNLARLAARGVNFRRAYCNSPVCVSARTALMTGRYPHEVGAYDNASPFAGGAPTFANLAHTAGYRCVASGKLDLWGGRDYGFEEIDAEHGHDTSPCVMAFFRDPMCRRCGTGAPQPPPVREGPNSDQRYLRRTLEFIRQNRARPWLAWTGWNAPHNPYRCRRDLFESYPLDRIDLPSFPPDWRETEHPVMKLVRHHFCLPEPVDDGTLRIRRAAYYGMITEIDEMLGELLAALDETGQTDRTVVIFTSDHGDMIGEHGYFTKYSMYDASARVPLVMAGPGLPAAATVPAAVSHVDLCATIADLCGAAGGGEMRGRSLLPLACGRADASRPVYMELNAEAVSTGVFSIVDGDWKYNYYAGHRAQLFNLREDPGEWRDRAADPACADVRCRLDRQLREIVDPDEISARAFADQERRLTAHLAGRTLAGALGDAAYLRDFTRRMGDEQTRELLALHFSGKTRHSR